MKKLLTILLICLFVSQYAFAYNPPWKTFTSDGTIQTGDSWWGVDIYDTSPNHTTVTMTGGMIVDDGIAVYNAATFNFSGGSPGWITAYDQSTVNIIGGLSAVSVGDNATGNISGNAIVPDASTGGSGTLNIYGGTISIQFYAWDNSIVNIYGGTINGLNIDDSTVLNLRGGLISSVSGSSLTTINVFGYDLAKTSSQITGFWQDSSPFAIDLYGPVTHINLIPEPTTFLLFGLGTFLLRKSKSRMKKHSV